MPMASRTLAILEKLPHPLGERALELASELDPRQFPSLRRALNDYHAAAARAAQNQAFVNLALVGQLRTAAEKLLDRYADLDAEGRLWASVAIKYFLLRDDHRNGFDDPAGFDDDTLVMDAVAAALDCAGSSPGTSGAAPALTPQAPAPGG